VAVYFSPHEMSYQLWMRCINSPILCVNTVWVESFWCCCFFLCWWQEPFDTTKPTSPRPVTPSHKTVGFKVRCGQTLPAQYIAACDVYCLVCVLWVVFSNSLWDRRPLTTTTWVIYMEYNNECALYEYWYTVGVLYMEC